MPCDSSHMLPKKRERGMGRLIALFEEATGEPGERPVNTKSALWSGNSPEVYGKGITQGMIDNATAALCKILTEKEDLTGYSLDLQMWWRDHQEHDRQREESERRRAKRDLDRAREDLAKAKKRWEKYDDGEGS